MRRPTRPAIALAAVLATVPVTLTSADLASGGGAPAAVAAATKTRAAASVTSAALATAAPPSSILGVEPGASVALRSRPGGPVALRLGDRTEFGSPRRLGVVERRGRWLGVTTPALPNGTLGWIDRRAPSVRIRATRWAISADLSSRTVVLRRGGEPVRRLSVAVGRPGSPTPIGRFAVKDKLSGSDYGPYYGCCILALSATQPNLPRGWTGGDRMAIHGASDPSSVGAAASAGCLRASDRDLTFLMDRVPVGTPVTIRR